jgi:hypothetical protein
MVFHDVIAGLLVGVLVGMSGMGGASLMAPILIYLFHFKAKYAVGSDLAYAGIAKAFGTWQHYKAGHVNLRLVWRLALGSVPSSLVGVWLLHTIDQRNGAAAEALITHLIGAVLIMVAGVMVARMIPRVEAWFAARHAERPEPSLAVMIAVGAVGGFLVGLTSVGAGTLFGVALIVLFGLSAKQLVGTDICHACILSLVAATAHVWAGDVDYALVGSLLIGAIPGVLLGGYIATRMPESALRPTLATILLITGLKILV